MLKHGEACSACVSNMERGLGFGAPGANLLQRGLADEVQRSECCAGLNAGRAGVPMEVMGLMLGEFVDDYTVRVVDVFAMPQSGTGVSVEAVDPVFQTKMLDMLKQTGRWVLKDLERAIARLV
eukprot:scaffold18203_cov33-Tisochrysis_lutea.AAC.1